MNKYQYCLNNPLKYVDPDGHQEKKSLTEQVKQSLRALWEGSRARDLDDPRDNPRDPNNRNYGPGIPKDTGAAAKEFTKSAGEAYNALAELYAEADPTGLMKLAYEGMKYDAGFGSKGDVGLAALGVASNFATPAKALGHFSKHALEFGFGHFKNAVEYVKGARALLDSTGSDVVRYVNKAGKELVYNKATNEFATRTGKTIHTFFKPKDGQKYVDDVVKKEGYTAVP